MNKLPKALWWRGERRKESLQLCLWNLNSTSNSPVAFCRLGCQTSANQCEVETSMNVNKHWKTCAKGNDVIMQISISHRLFWCRHSNSRDLVASSFSFLPCHQSTPWRLPQATYTVDSSAHCTAWLKTDCTSSPYPLASPVLTCGYICHQEVFYVL